MGIELKKRFDLSSNLQHDSHSVKVLKRTEPKVATLLISFS